MLASLGVLTIIALSVAIISRKMSPLVALIMIPIIAALIGDFGLKTGVFIGVKLSQRDAERPAALGSEAKRNGDGRALFYFSRLHRVPFRILLFY
jgi:hypothetical protein